ncbi:MAG TPA: hypothetical protein PLI09_18830 [Candidatus Hydrogenedentes bacterium]|nr:hypothetical protein [Candidatus Hydrogenedentota bacterium]
MKYRAIVWILIPILFLLVISAAYAETKTKMMGTEEIQSRLDDLSVIIKTNESSPEHLAAIKEYAQLMARPSARPVEITIGKFNALLEYTRTVEEKKAVLENLSGLKHPYTLFLLLPFIPQEPLRDAAYESCIHIARQIRAAYPEAVDSILNDMLRMVSDKKRQKALWKILAQPVHVKDYLLGWQVAGTYDNNDAMFPPGQPGSDAAAWHVLPVDLSAWNPGTLDLANALGTKAGTAYLRTWLHSPADQNAELVLSSKSHVTVRLNGVCIFKNDSAPRWISRKDVIPLTLIQGENSLMIKAVHPDGTWKISAKLYKADGAPLGDVSCYLK